MDGLKARASSVDILHMALVEGGKRQICSQTAISLQIDRFLLQPATSKRVGVKTDIFIQIRRNSDLLVDVKELRNGHPQSCVLFVKGKERPRNHQSEDKWRRD